jgi:hypothetical protein
LAAKSILRLRRLGKDARDKVHQLKLAVRLMEALTPPGSSSRAESSPLKSRPRSIGKKKSFEISLSGMDI